MVVGNKRGNENKSQAMLFDIEGTTTSISFVKDTLFPYVRQNLKEFVERQWNETEFHGVLSLLKDQSKQDAANGIAGVVPIPDEGTDKELQEAVVNSVLWQMDGDLKNKALKKLQGHIMREGYKKGELKGHVYPDVVPSLKSWVQNGCKLYVYSSGSVEAQKLLFGHSQEGDLLELFQGHFDTEVGPKTEARSYSNIMEQLEYQADDVVFFTDIPKEAIAAEEAGMTAILVIREGNAVLTEDDRARFQVIETFEDFEREAPAKRRKVSIEEENGGAEEVKAVVEKTPKEVETEKAPVVTEDTPLVTEDTPVVTEDIPVVTEDKPVVTKDTQGVTETSEKPDDIPVVDETEKANNEVDQTSVEDVEMKDVSEATLPTVVDVEKTDVEVAEEKDETKAQETKLDPMEPEKEGTVTEPAKVDAETVEPTVNQPDKVDDKSEIKESKTDSVVDETVVVSAPVVQTDGKKDTDEKMVAITETEPVEKAVDTNDEVLEKTEEIKLDSIETPVEVKSDEEKIDGEAKIVTDEVNKVEDEKISQDVPKEDEPMIQKDEIKETSILDEVKESAVTKEEDIKAHDVEEGKKEIIEKGQVGAGDVESPMETVENGGEKKAEDEGSECEIAGDGDKAEAAVVTDG